MRFGRPRARVRVRVEGEGEWELVLGWEGRVPASSQKLESSTRRRPQPHEHQVVQRAHLQEAAGLGLAGMTAYQGLFEVAKIEKDQSIFINGGTTAVGIYATQLAKAIGCKVTVAASTKKEETCSSLGVNHVREVPF